MAPVFPGCALVLTSSTLNLLGDGLRDASIRGRAVGELHCREACLAEATCRSAAMKAAMCDNGRNPYIRPGPPDAGAGRPPRGPDGTVGAPAVNQRRRTDVDGDRFDALTAAGAANRRVLVRSLGTAAVAALLGCAPGGRRRLDLRRARRPMPEGEADCRATGCKKKRGQKKGRRAPRSNDRMFCGDTCCPRFGLGFDCADGRGVCLGCPVGALPRGESRRPPELCDDGACDCPDGRESGAGAATGIQCCLAGDTCGCTLGCQSRDVPVGDYAVRSP